MQEGNVLDLLSTEVGEGETQESEADGVGDSESSLVLGVGSS